MRTLAIPLLAFVAVVGVGLPPARGAELLVGAPVYREDFAGEKALPTIPELDVFGLGGLNEVNIGDGPFVPLQVDGANGLLHFQVNGNPGPAVTVEDKVAIAAGTRLAADVNVALSGQFKSFAPAFNGLGAVHAEVLLLGDSGATIEGLLSDGNTAGSDLLEIIVLEGGPSQPQGQADNSQVRVALPSAVGSAILAGDSFDIDLRVDRQLGEASAALRTGGQEFVTSALGLTRIASQRIAGIGVFGAVLGFVNDPKFGGPVDFGENDAVSFDLLELRAFASTPCTGVAVTKPTLTIGKLNTPPGDDRLSFKGSFTLPTPVSPALNPLADGVELLIQDNAGNVLDAALPGGAVTNGSGWKVNRNGTTYTYQNKAPASTGGIFKMTIQDKSKKTPGLVKFSVSGKAGSYSVAAADLPVTARVHLAPSGSGQCGDATFASCGFNALGSTLKCK